VAISIYDQFVPPFTRMLTNLDNVLQKAEADCEARKIDPSVFINGRLAPDMLPLVRQVQIATDHAKGAASRLAGQDNPKWSDDEKSFADLHARVVAYSHAGVIDQLCGRAGTRRASLSPVLPEMLTALSLIVTLAPAQGCSERSTVVRPSPTPLAVGGSCKAA